MRYSAFLTGLLLCVNGWAYTEGDVTAAQLQAIVTSHGQQIAETKNAFQTDEGSTKNISMYQLANATTWTADMDTDCDGAQTEPVTRKQLIWALSGPASFFRITMPFSLERTHDVRMPESLRSPPGPSA